MTARVHDISAIRDFRPHLVRFAEELESALQTMFLEIQKGFEWIEHEQPRYWTSESRKAYDAVASTRVAFTSCQMRTVAGRKSSCIEEKIAHDKAKQRLAHCQQQMEHVKLWSIKLRHESDEFRGRLAGLRRLLDRDIPQALARLEKIVSTLEAYAEVQRPLTGEASGAST